MKPVLKIDFKKFYVSLANVWALGEQYITTETRKVYRKLRKKTFKSALLEESMIIFATEFTWKEGSMNKLVASVSLQKQICNEIKFLRKMKDKYPISE